MTHLKYEEPGFGAAADVAGVVAGIRSGQGSVQSLQ